jgi:Ca2+/H+ antiporter
MQSLILLGGKNYHDQIYEFNDEKHVFAMLLILVLTLLFCPNMIRKELQGVKKYILI